MKIFTRATRFAALLFAISMLLAACTTSQTTPLFPAPEIGDITIDGDTITITGAHFFQVHAGSTLPNNLTITVCGELLGNLVLNGETKTVIFAPGSIETITTATKIIGKLTGNFIAEHDGVRIINPDGQTINIDVDCGSEPEEPYADPSIFQVTIDFSAVDEDDYDEDDYYSYLNPKVINPDEYTLFFLPLSGFGTIEINWGDGTTSTVEDPNAFSYYRHEDLVHEYGIAGRFIITVTGDLEEATFGPGENAFFDFDDDEEEFSYYIIDDEMYPDKRYFSMAALVSLDSWGLFEYEHLIGAFANMPNLKSVPNYLPEGVTEIYGMFFNASSFNSPIGGWNISGVTELSGLFALATSFNQDISGWDVSDVEEMDIMFYGASSFNQDIDGWDVSNVIYMPSLFAEATSFNKSINSWNVEQVEDMSFMFYGATAFNQPLHNWNPLSAEEMWGMFLEASAFSQDISSWCVPNIHSRPTDFDSGSLIKGEPALQPNWGCIS